MPGFRTCRVRGGPCTPAHVFDFIRLASGRPDWKDLNGGLHSRGLRGWQGRERQEIGGSMPKNEFSRRLPKKSHLRRSASSLVIQRTGSTPHCGTQH